MMATRMARLKTAHALTASMCVKQEKGEENGRRWKCRRWGENYQRALLVTQHIVPSSCAK